MPVHHAYGCVIRSPLEFPHLEAASPGAVPDVEVRIGPTPERLNPLVASGLGWQFDGDHILVQVGRVARCLVRSGRSIVVTPARDATDADVQFAVLNGALGPILHQRGAFVLHASAVDIGGRAVAVAGHSGAGKSTLLLALIQKGARMLTDDVAPISVSADGAIELASGIPVVGVWPDTADHFAYPVDDLHMVRPHVRKYQVPVGVNDRRPHGRWPLSAVIVLEAHHIDAIEHRRVIGRTAFAMLRRYTRGLRLAEGVQRARHFEMAAAVAHSVPVHVVRRPRSGVSTVDALADTVWPLVCR